MIKFEFVESPHWSTGDPRRSEVARSQKDTPEFLKPFLDGWCLLPTANATIYHLYDNPIGVFRYNLFERELYSEGTFVDQRFQKNGIASSLWIETLNKFNPKIVHLQLASKEGKLLITKIKNIFNHVEFKITEYEDI